MSTDPVPRWSAEPAPPDAEAKLALARMTPYELAWGWKPGFEEGHRPRRRPLPASAGLTPIEALERAIRPHLERPPCVVEFSGGRDSSTVLAVAVGLARREGLPLPIPYTQRFPGVAESEENDWQDFVIDFLGLKDWHLRNFTDELDLIGPIAGPSLLRFGLLWPPLVHTRWPAFEVARGGSLIGGEGGDEVFGERRLTIARRLIPGVVRRNRKNLTAAALSFAPRAVRRAGARQRNEGQLVLTWMRPAVRERLLDEIGEQQVGEPLDWRRAVRSLPFTVAARVMQVTFGYFGGLEDVVCGDPLLDEVFIDAVTRFGRVRGFRDRTSAMHQVFGQLLPDKIWDRTSKARFNRAVFTHYSRDFAEHWDGSGVDPEVVDAEALREVWRSEEPSGMSFGLLQAAWLAAVRNSSSTPAPAQPGLATGTPNG